MAQVKWFERKFDFSYEQNIFPAIIERLEGTAIRLAAKIKSIQPDQLGLKQNEKWSIKENIGHLIDLEPIWHGRLQDIKENKEYLRPADLENNKTHNANHNDSAIGDLLAEFQAIRSTTVQQVRELTEEEIYKTALHPRLKKPMRAMDLFLFVAEHDDHHLARITEITTPK